MNPSVRGKAVFWALAFAGALLFVFVFNAVLLPFVLGAVVAYILNPVVKRLIRHKKINRAAASLIILMAFLGMIFLLGVALFPLAYQEAKDLSREFPGYMDRAVDWLRPYTQQFVHYAEQNGNVDVDALVKENSGRAVSMAGSVFAGLAAGGRFILDILSVLVVMPIVAYFMMKDWDSICIWVEDLLPLEHKATIQDLLSQINGKLSGFIRGQLTVAAVLGIAYALALTFAGLKYGFIIGLFAGVLGVIPMIGSAIGLLLSTAMAWFQSGDLVYVGAIASIFLVGQLIEGNILTPRLMGKSIGMHPLWIFFALMAGGALFGVLGMLLAVPIAAVAGVLLAFAIARYKSGPFYQEHKTPPPS